MRIHYIDNIRWLTVVLVVLYHVIFMFNGIIPFGVIGPFHELQYQDAIQYILYPWFMVLLFLVSGMSAKYFLLTHTQNEFLRSRTRKLLVPSTIGVLTIGWLQGYLSTAFSEGALESIATLPLIIRYLILAVSGISVLWFSQMLWVFSLLLALKSGTERSKKRPIIRCSRINLPSLLLLGIFVWIAAQLFNTPVISVYRFGIYGFVFFLGYSVFSQEKVTDILAKWSIPLLTASVLLAVAYTTFYFGTNYATAPVVNSPFSILYGWVTCLALLGAAKRWGNKTNKFADYMRTRSFGIYTLHYFCISVSGYLLITYTKLAPVFIYLLVTVAAFTGAIILYELISRIPFLRWCVLGIKKEK